MHKNDKEIQPRPKKDIFLIISSLVLVLFTAVFLWLSLFHYQNRAQAISLSENRFLTTEWRLLQELKAQSDQKLLAKEKEIAGLTSRLLILERGNASRWEVRQIEIRLEQAKAEYEEILSQRLETNSEVDPQQKAWIAELLPAGTHSAVTKLLEKQIESLEIKQEESRLYIAELEQELAVLIAKHEDVTQEYISTVTEKLSQIKKLSATIEEYSQAAHAAFKHMTQKAEEIDNRARPSIEDLGTRALVRAIINSPAIKTEYPDLLKAFDRYFEVYGLQERLEGQQEVYSSLAAIIAQELESH